MAAALPRNHVASGEGAVKHGDAPLGARSLLILPSLAKNGQSRIDGLVWRWL